MSRRDRLAQIADRLDKINSEARDLYDERRTVWREEIAAGATVTEVAGRSRVKPFTVRALLARAASGE